MSNYSGFSTASRLALARMDKEVNAMAADRERMRIDQERTRLENEELRRQLQVAQNTPGTSAQAMARDKAHELALAHVHGPKSHSQAQFRPAHGQTTGRKRHNSDQLQGTAKAPKDGRNEYQNRFEVLTQSKSYPEKSMRPESVLTTPGINDKHKGFSYASKLGHSAKLAPSGRTTEDDALEAEAIFDIKNDRALRQEIEVHFVTINGEKFFGSITYQEAKHLVFKDCLGFGDFSNFDGARVGFKGSPTVTFKLKNAINVDELIHLQRFNFMRKSSRQGRSHTDRIGCKIFGLRRPGSGPQYQDQSTPFSMDQDNGIRKIQIQGCEYRIPKETLIEYLSNFGEIVSDIKEALFDDGGDPNAAEDGTNRTGNYNVKIKLNQDIPQLVPILGKRIKVHYPGVQRLCTNCFGNHLKTRCQSRKMTWDAYMAKFKLDYPEIDSCIIDRRTRDPMKDSTKQAISPSKLDQGLASDNGDTEFNYTNEWVDNIQVDSVSEVDNEIVMEPTESKSMNTVPNQNTDQIKSKPSPIKTNVQPQKKDFMVPLNQVQHTEMISSLVSAGISPIEAEQIISIRKNAFNKACREWKKMTESNSITKKSNKSSKIAVTKANRNGN